jgi:putative membrane-bound dehydrogenase-like protein
MRRLVLPYLFVAVCAGAALPPAAEFTLPLGFTAARVAAAPLTRYPMLINFDDRGRLFVAENAGVNLTDKELLAQTPSLVRMLEDTDGDGVFDRSTVFADKMTYPEGVLWHEGALYVASPPSIWKLEDLDGDGRADRRTEIATGFGFNGNAADVHGPWLHPDGRLYWPHARKPHEIFRAAGSLLSKGTGARIWTARLDGSDLRMHAGGGMDNPTGIAITDEGDILCTVNIFASPPRNDALVHFVHGGVYPRADQERTLAEFRRTGELLPAAASFGHVAIAGMALAQSPAWPAEFRGNAFVAEFNTRRLLRVPLRREGATWRGAPEVFATTATDGVHFTDVIEDADGSLLVVDTGGWLRNGCPTSGVPRAEILGGIYRIRKTGTPAIADPRGQDIAWAKLFAEKIAALLGDPRPVVRARAIAEAAKRADVPALQKSLAAAEPLARLNALWALTRIATPAAQSAARRGFADLDARVRQVAATSAFTTADAGAFTSLVAALRDPDLAVRREAARALGALKNSAAIPALAAATAEARADVFLLHALGYALLEIGDTAALAPLLDHAAPSARRAALIALDQLPDSAPPAAAVFAALSSDDAPLRTAALGIALKHPEWGSEAAAFLARSAAPADTTARMLAAFIAAPAVRAWLRENLSVLPPSAILDAIASAKPAAWDEAWRPFLLASLHSAAAPAALRAIAAHRARDFSAALREFAADEQRPAALRVAALQAAAGADTALDTAAFAMLTAPFTQGGSAESRLQAAAVFPSVKLTREQYAALAALLPAAGPLELPPLLRAFARGPFDRALGELILEKLRAAPARFGLVGGEVQALLRRYGSAVELAAVPLVSEILNQTASQAARVAELEKLAATGDAARGRAAFLAGAGACVSCHRVGDTGAMIGPDLSRIGAIRTPRDLAEAIAFPSATLARGYESFTLQLEDGTALTGTIPAETATELVVATADGKETKMARDRVAKIEAVTASLMPPGLDRALKPQTLADLIAYFHSLK